MADGRIVAVGSRADVEALIGPGHRDRRTRRRLRHARLRRGARASADGGHRAVAIGSSTSGRSPCANPTRSSPPSATRSPRAAPTGAYLNGWDPLLQDGLPEPTLAWLDGMAPDTPLVIIHNSGHQGVLQLGRRASSSGLTRDTPDPKGAKYGRDANGELDGTAEETGAVFPLIGGAVDPDRLPGDAARRVRAAEPGRADHVFRDGVRPDVPAGAGALREQLTVRLRVYEMSTAADVARRETPSNGDDVVRQVGIKIWVDGSPWIGNIDLSFPYLDTEATRTIGVTPGSCGHANYTREQLTEIVARVLPAGLADGVPRPGRRRRRHDPRRLRGSPAAASARRSSAAARARRRHHERAAAAGPRLGVTCSIFVDQIHYWGDVIVDGLFGPEHGDAVDARGLGGRDRHADLAAQRSARHAGGAAAQHQRGGHPGRAERSRAGAGGAADRRAGDPGADHRRGVAAAVRGHHRLAGGRQVRRPGGAVGRSARGAAGGHRGPGRPRDVPRGSEGARG